jgi:uridylate kinase
LRSNVPRTRYENCNVRTVVTYGLGATISNKDGTIDLTAVRSIAEQFKSLVIPARSKKEGLQIVAVVGAGGLGRSYQEFASEQIRDRHKKDEGGYLDRIGIMASRVNALLLASVIRSLSVVTNAKIPETNIEVARYLSDGFECTVLGGIEPGMTSDSTAARIAQENKGPLVIVSTVGGIYSDDQKNASTARNDKERMRVEQPGARMLQRIDRSYLKGIISLGAEKEKKSHVLDPQTSKILLENKNQKMKAIVTGYPNILSSTKQLLLDFQKAGRKSTIEGATLIEL